MQFKSFFDLDNRLEDIDRMGDPLAALDKVIEWEAFRPLLARVHDKERKSNAGRRPYDVVLMLKILILQSLYNLSDNRTEFMIRDRLSFARFLKINLSDRVPDENTIWDFREALKKHDLLDSLFTKFEAMLCEQGFAAKKGQILDASITSAPVQRNSREENKKVKAGEGEELWPENKAKKAQKDTDARWTKKHGKSHFGYKNHIGVDNKHKLIRTFAVTPASTHDSQLLGELIDPNNSSGDVWADAAYWSAESNAELEAAGYRPRIHRKGTRKRPLSPREEKGNHTRSKTRSRVEHVFGIQSKVAGDLTVRTIGLVRAKMKIGLRNLAYNMNRLKCLLRPPRCRVAGG